MIPHHNVILMYAVIAFAKVTTPLTSIHSTPLLTLHSHRHKHPLRRVASLLASLHRYADHSQGSTDADILEEILAAMMTIPLSVTTIQTVHQHHLMHVVCRKERPIVCLEQLLLINDQNLPSFGLTPTCLSLIPIHHHLFTSETIRKKTQKLLWICVQPYGIWSKER